MVSLQVVVFLVVPCFGLGIIHIFKYGKLALWNKNMSHQLLAEFEQQLRAHAELNIAEAIRRIVILDSQTLFEAEFAVELEEQDYLDLRRIAGQYLAAMYLYKSSQMLVTTVFFVCMVALLLLIVSISLQ